jgi:energy-coupling factor transport system permease protein
MHPAIKIISFLVFGASVSFGGDRALLFGLLLLTGFYLLSPLERVFPALRLLARMRWFFLSIAMVYVFFSPGRLLFSALPWGPTWEGVHEGMTRIGVLVLIVLAVNLLLRTTERDALTAAILWCLRPLSWLGLPHERLAVRIALTLDTVGAVQGIYRHGPRSDEVETARQPLTVRLARVGEAAKRLFVTVAERAESAPLHIIELPVESRPALLQWLFPLVLGSVFLVLNW